jgi:hypothetical protein
MTYRPPGLRERSSKHISCSPNACPDGMRVETMGRRYLLDCEPWLHEERTYVTRHSVAEQQCVECSVQSCVSCDKNKRKCEQCMADNSLYVEDGTGIHSCVPKENCPGDMFTNCGLHGDECQEDGRPGWIPVCTLWTVCGAGQIEAPDGSPTKTRDRVCTAVPTEAKPIGPAIGVVVVAFALFGLAAVSTPPPQQLTLRRSHIRRLNLTLRQSRILRLNIRGQYRLSGNRFLLSRGLMDEHLHYTSDAQDVHLQHTSQVDAGWIRFLTSSSIYTLAPILDNTGHILQTSVAENQAESAGHLYLADQRKGSEYCIRWRCCGTCCAHQGPKCCQCEQCNNVQQPTKRNTSPR